MPNIGLADKREPCCDTGTSRMDGALSAMLLPDDLQTLRQLDDTARLAYGRLDREACRRLQRGGFLGEDDGWWRITDLGRVALATTSRCRQVPGSASPSTKR